MKVSSILRSKGTHVETAREATSIGEAAKQLSDRRIGSLVILDETHRVVGVLAERDLVRAFAEHGRSAEDLTVGEVMATHPAVCRPGDSLEQVMSVMTHRRARHLPVVVEDALVGIVSIGDVVKSQLETLKLEVGVLRDYARVRS